MTTNTGETPELLACSDAVRKAVDPLLLTHDGRLLFACLAAETAHLGALLRASGIYRPDTVARTFSEAMVTALTLETKAKVMYTEGDEQLGTKQ